MAIKNIKLTIRKIRADSKMIVDMEAAGKLKIIGGMYDLASGKINYVE